MSYNVTETETDYIINFVVSKEFTEDLSRIIGFNQWKELAQIAGFEISASLQMHHYSKTMPNLSKDEIYKIIDKNMGNDISYPEEFRNEVNS